MATDDSSRLFTNMMFNSRLRRHIAAAVRTDLTRKMVFMSGPRRVGKATLAYSRDRLFSVPIDAAWVLRLETAPELATSWGHTSWGHIFHCHIGASALHGFLVDIHQPAHGRVMNAEMRSDGRHRMLPRQIRTSHRLVAIVALLEICRRLLQRAALGARYFIQ
jgi:hypothetical protein